MAHGKETPRQKMIGMMYLVLMAMLALQVQKEVLNAFVNVDEGLVKTTENFDVKNQMIYKDIAKAAAINPEKARQIKSQADEVKQRADELFEYIQDLKLEIVRAADGEDAKAIHGRDIHPMQIEGKDNMDRPAQIMIGGAENIKTTKAFELKSKIIEFREYLLSLTSESDTTIRNSIKKSLDTSDPPVHEGQTHSWESTNFEHLPLIGVTTIMSGFQGDVRNAESEILRFLYSSIDEGSIPFNSIEATVIPNSGYIIRGNEYQASVFLAARDTTQPPIVMVGDYEEYTNEEGEKQYRMVGSYDSLDIVNGRGIYNVQPSRTGNVEWGGLIKLRKPDGSYIVKPFQESFQVAEPSIVISPIKMNVFYRGIENPVKIEMAGIPSTNILPSISNGRIRKTGDQYIVTPGRENISTMRVTAEVDGTRKPMGSMEFRVKDLPPPTPKLAGRNGGNIEQSLLTALDGIYADMGEDFMFDVEYNVVGFTVNTTDRGGFTLTEESESSRFTPAQKEMFTNMRRGQKFYIEDIRAVGPDGAVKNLGAMAFRVGS